MDKLIFTATENQTDMNEKSFALLMDERDPLRHIRKQFEYPLKKNLPGIDILNDNTEENESVYMCGSSLGLMPTSTREIMTQVLDQWGEWAVYGHDNGPLPWQLCDEQLVESMAKIVGALEDEVSIMNQLTVNLHLLMMSFYRPTLTRNKILYEHKPFPSDQYALESQVRLHGFNPDDILLCVPPRSGEHCARLEDILAMIAKEGENLALVCMSAVNFYTGEFIDVEVITREAHKIGAVVGWDLAHAVGNVELYLHDWDVDWAVWCTYKYLNAGPGSSGAAFLHSKHFEGSFPYLQGWWGHEYKTRMEMHRKMIPGLGIRKLRMSTPSAFHCATLRASLKIFDSIGMSAIRSKSLLLTAYLEHLFCQINERYGRTVLEIITPSNINRRGAQLSIRFLNQDIENFHISLKKKGLVCDKRKPDVIRIAACPLYNSFMDVYKTYEIICDVLELK